MLPIVGQQQTSLIDFPGKIATVFFFAGCNLRCPYCHNGTILDVRKEEIIPKEKILADIERRSKFIDGVCFTGGEPSLYDELLDFIKEIKEKFNLAIKIDTNGLRPEFVEKALPFVDRFAVDIKTTPELYKKLGTNLNKEEVKEKLLKTKELFENTKDVDVEYRTTMYPPIVESYERIYKMFEFIPGNAEYYLQRFIGENAMSMDARNVKSYTVDQLERMAMELRRNTRRDKIFVRSYA